MIKFNKEKDAFYEAEAAFYEAEDAFNFLTFKKGV
jgi:hypothetical protein